MSLTIHAVQSYVRTKKGRIGHAEIRECQTAEIAKRAAQRMVESGRVLGAMAFSKSLDSATGQLDVLRIIGSYGTVCEPEDELPF